MEKTYELTEEQWAVIAPQIVTGPSPKGGRPRKDDRAMLEAMIWRDRSGARWRDIPKEYGPWQSVYSRFRKWKKIKLFPQIFAALIAEANLETVSVDSTCSKVHQSANGCIKGANAKPLGAQKAD